MTIRSLSLAATFGSLLFLLGNTAAFFGWFVVNPVF
jgi:hypothetical protein